jgi:flagellar operon protein
VTTGLGIAASGIPAPGLAATGGSAASAPAVPRPASALPGPSAAFGPLLAARTGDAAGLRFSGHALDRLERRGISLDEQALARLEGGVTRAAAKGARDSLVMLDGTAFVVSVRNRTVVTAVDRQHMHEQVFTNIDSAVIA